MAGCLRPDTADMSYKYTADAVGPGWAKIVQPLIDYCETHDIAIHQIKEKFGGLRFYVGEASDEFHSLVEAAEKEAAVTCEECGEPGKSRPTGWIKTLCDSHFEALKRKKD